MAELLTDLEVEALELSGRLGKLLAQIVGSAGPTADRDWAELSGALHVIQRAVAAQAACRAYPERGYRLLGEARAAPSDVGL